MNILFNSNPVQLTEPVTLLSFLNMQLENCDAVLSRSVVAINQQIMPRNNYTDYILQDNDEIELLTAMVGG